MPDVTQIPGKSKCEGGRAASEQIQRDPVKIQTKSSRSPLKEGAVEGRRRA